ncbi:ABC transporter permease [Campylobacterota bacterium DY0563]
MRNIDSKKIADIAIKFYFFSFFIYLFLPLLVVSLAAFNESSIPTIYPWKGFSLHWINEFFQDYKLFDAILNSLIIGLGVVILSIPIGLAGALFLLNINKKARDIFYAILVSPILTPGVIIGIATLVMWNNLFEVSGGIILTIVGQTTFISSMAMLLFMSRLQKFDKNLELAALDLGATHIQLFFKITVPFLKPAIFSATALAFLQSIQNYNTTLFLIGTQSTITIHIGSMVKLGLTPVLNVLALIIILVTIGLSTLYVLKKRKENK